MSLLVICSSRNLKYQEKVHLLSIQVVELEPFQQPIAQLVEVLFLAGLGTGLKCTTLCSLRKRQYI